MKLAATHVRARLKALGIETNTALTGSQTVTIDTAAFVTLIKLASTRGKKQVAR